MLVFWKQNLTKSIGVKELTQISKDEYLHVVWTNCTTEKIFNGLLNCDWSSPEMTHQGGEQ